MRNVTITAFLLASSVGAATAHAQATPRSALLILSKSDQTLAIVEPGTLKVIARVPVGPDPHEVIASTDGSTAYVSNYGGGAFNTLAVIDLVAQKPLPSIDLGPLRGPHGLVFVAGKPWFTAEAAKVVASYDPATKKVDWVLGTGQNRTHMLAVSQDQKRIVTTNVNSATVSIIDKSAGHGPGGPPGGPNGPNGPNGPPPNGPNGGPPPNGPGHPPMGPPGGDWDETVIPVGRGSEGFDIAPGGKEIWVANAQDGTISIIDTGSKSVIQTLTANVQSANRLKFTPDGRRVFVSMLRNTDVAIFDVVSRKEEKRVKIGHGAAGILMNPDGSRAYVACTPDSYVVAIDLKTLEVVGHIKAGANPDGLAWAVRN